MPCRNHVTLIGGRPPLGLTPIQFDEAPSARKTPS